MREPAIVFTPTLDLLLVFTISMPIAGWAAIRIHRKVLCGAYTVAGLAAAGAFLYGLFLDVSQGTVISTPHVGVFSAYLRIDMLGVFMATISIGIGLAVAIYSIIYMEKDTGLPIYFTLLLAIVSGMVGVVFAGDLFTLYIFWELMCVSTYVLVAFRRGRSESIEAAFKYLMMSVAGSATAFLGMSLLYGMSGTLNFEGLALAFGQAQPNAWLYLASLLILTGFGVTTAIVPLHTWLPDAHSVAPSPISAILSGVVIETGIYVLSRTCFSAFLSIQAQWLAIVMALSVITMVVGNVMPLLQNDLKRLLAYSSIAQVGYMLAGLSIGTQLGLTGTFMQIFNHALMKGTAFLCAGAILYTLGTRQLDEMAGIGRRMPITAVAFTISLLALIGMPPLNGFVSELIIVTSAFQANLAWLGVTIILNGILSAAFYLRVLRVLIQPIGSEKVERAREAPWVMLLPICFMAGLIVLFGLWPDPLIRFTQQSVAGLFSFVGQVVG